MRLVALLAAAAAAIAWADEGATLYTVDVWERPAGPGLVRVIGPISAAACERVRLDLYDRHPPIPPDMQHSTSQCVPQGQLSVFLAPRHCAASASDSVPTLPQARVWVYNCLGFL